MEGVTMGMLCCLLLVTATAGEVSFPHGFGRSLAEASNSSQLPNTTTSDRTVRIDPLKNFEKYKGGYNITNKHYWSSVIFTGISGYSIGVLWLLGGVIYGGFLLIEATCCNKKNRKKKKEEEELPSCRTCCLWPVALAILLTLLLMIASGVALAGSLRFHTRANNVKRIISTTADDASQTIYNLTTAVTAIQANTEHYGVTVLKTSAQLNSTSQKLSEEAYRIRDKANKNVRIIGKGLTALQTITVVILSLNLLVIFSLLCWRLLKFRRPFQMFLIVCWFLAFFLWMFFGLYFFLDRFAGDTCLALEDYRQEPGNSSLSSILPCSNQRSSKSALHSTKAGISTLINQVNANLTASRAVLPVASLRLICNPFSKPPNYDYHPESCAENTTKIGDIPMVLKNFACSESECAAGEFIPAVDYAAISNFSISIQQLLDSLPGVENLVSCKLVKDAFSDILYNQCHPLRRGAKLSWAAMVAVAALAALLAASWAAMYRHDAKRRYSSGGSVRPEVAGNEEVVETVPV